MIEFTQEAKNLRDEYLRQVRAYVSASGKADVEDVLRDVEEHLERELHSSPQPISGAALKDVLDRLGSPSNWIPTEDLSWWRKVVLRARVGPEDWRLAYATFGLLLMGVLFGWIFCNTYTQGYGAYNQAYHRFNIGVFVMFVIASFVLARATLATVGSSQISAGQKWLVYPPLVMVYPVIAAVCIGWAPAVAGGVTFELLHQSLRQHSTTVGFGTENGRFRYADAQAGAVAVIVATLAAGVWWTVLSFLHRGRIGQFVQFLFRPVLDTSLRKFSRIYLILGIIMIVLGAVGFTLIA